MGSGRSRPPAVAGTTTARSRPARGNGIHLKVHTHGRWAMAANFGPINNLKLLVCPSDKSPSVINTTSVAGNSTNVLTSYAFNAELYITGTKLIAVPPAQTLLAMDGLETLNLQTGVWYGNINPSKKKNDVDRFNNSIIAKRHGNQFNALYVDAHVERQTRVAYDALLPGWQ